MSVLKGNFILKQLFLNFNTLYIKTGINYDTRSFQKFKSNMLSTKTLSIFYITSFYISIEFNETKQKFLNLLCITLKLRAFYLTTGQTVSKRLYHGAFLFHSFCVYSGISFPLFLRYTSLITFTSSG